MKNVILPHEHLCIDLSTVKKNDDTNLNNFDEIIQEMKELKANGVAAIVDVTNIGMGRNVKKVHEMEKASGVKVLYSTGYYQQKFYFDLVKNQTVDQIEKRFIDEIKNGIDGTKIKASVIGEIGTTLNQITDQERKVLTAASRAAKKTNTVLLTHCSLGTMGEEQIALMQKEHLDLSRVILSHLELKNDINYLLRILATGVNISIDTCGKEEYLPDATRIKMIKTIIEKGYIKQVLLSRDISRKSYTKSRGGSGWIYLLKEFKNKLLAAGVTEAQIEQMMVTNPWRIYFKEEK